LQALNTIFFREPDGCPQQRKSAYPILPLGPPQTLVVLLREDKEEAAEETTLMKKEKRQKGSSSCRIPTASESGEIQQTH
jgi:hypothetical protein